MTVYLIAQAAGEVMFNADTLRKLIISLVAFLIGLVLFGMWQMWRDRHDVIPHRPVPISARMAFGFSYVLMLLHILVERYLSLGSGPVRPATLLVAPIVLFSLIPVALMLYHRRDEATPGLLELARRKGFVGGLLRLVVFRQVLDDICYSEKYGAPVHPGRRRVDKLPVADMIHEAEQAVERGLREDINWHNLEQENDDG